jgi:hypothetical protein
MPALDQLDAGRDAALGGQEAAREIGGIQSSCREWEQTWRDLTAEAESLELGCAEERLKIAQLAEYQDDANDSPMGARIGLWTWMDECLWGGLVELRAEVKAEDMHTKEKDEKVIKDKKAEKGKKEKREASSSGSSDDEEHEKDKKKQEG